MMHSIVIPAHNEAANLENFVSDFLIRLEADVPDIDVEVLVVENGSSDGTMAAAERLEQEHPGVVRALAIDRGSYGEAIKRGMLDAAGETVSVLEVDFLDSGFVAHSLEALREGVGRFAIASKQHAQSVDGRPVKRRVLTRLFNIIIHSMLGYPGSDTHGLKTIDGTLAKRLCEQALTTDELFQTEIVLLAWRQGECIVELPIRLEEKRASPVSIRRRIPMVLDLVRQLRRSMKRFVDEPAGRVEARTLKGY